MIYRTIVLFYRTIYPENIAQFLIFYRTRSCGLLFEVPSEQCLNEGRYCNKQTLFHLHARILKVFTYWGKEVLKKYDISP